MNAVDSGRVAIVATELASNLRKHAAGGVILLSAFEDSTGVGVECVALDSGPGISDVSTALRDGYSTAGGSGTGLGAVQRLSHVFDDYSRPGLGSAFLARVQPGEPHTSDNRIGPRWGAAGRGQPSEIRGRRVW